jgi:hypothetical protein
VTAALLTEGEFDHVPVRIDFWEHFFIVPKGREVDLVRIKVCADITQYAKAHPDLDMEDTDQSKIPLQTFQALGPEIGRLNILLPIRAKITEGRAFFDLEGLILEDNWLEKFRGGEQLYKQIGKFEIKEAECSKFMFSKRIPQPLAFGVSESYLLFKQSIINIK